MKATRAETQGVRKVITYCRVCEATCGLVATVEDGRIVSVEGDRDHVLSKGHFCKKAMGAVGVTYDPDRVIQPLKRVGGPGEFAPISWKQAIDEIADRLSAIRREHGPTSFATFFGQPPTNAYAMKLWLDQFRRALGSKWLYSINSEDAAAAGKACDLLFGPGVRPKPDFWRTDFAIIIGANPFVSHGSLCSEPLIRDALKSVVTRGGRVVVVDPRRSETAQSFEHVGIHAASDPWFLLALLSEIIRNGWVDKTFIDRFTTGFEELAALVSPFTVEEAADRCGLAPEVIRNLARDFAAAPTAVLYGRLGTCTQPFGTLNNLLQSLICIVTGNLDKPGAMAVPWLPIKEHPLVSGGAPRSGPSRTTGLPDVGGVLPSRAIIPDILEPGPEQVRALMMIGSNPALTSGAAGEGYTDALDKLDLHFSLDLYINETNRHAHYILPATTMFERADISLKYMFSQLRPSIWATKAVVRPTGEAREEWQIMNAICRRMGLGGAYASPWLRRLARIGINVRPMALADFLLRRSEIGDGFGRRRGGLSMSKLLKHHPHGKSLSSDLHSGLLSESRKIKLTFPELESEIARLKARRDPDAYPFRMIGLREMLTHNTWMHNVPSLKASERGHSVRLNPDDARDLGVDDGDRVEITSSSGSVEVAVTVSDRMKRGNIALPHGWGHLQGCSGDKAGGVNSNLLAGKGMEGVEALAGMSTLNGIPVRIARSAAPA